VFHTDLCVTDWRAMHCCDALYRLAGLFQLQRIRMSIHAAYKSAVLNQIVGTTSEMETDSTTQKPDMSSLVKSRPSHKDIFHYSKLRIFHSYSKLEVLKVEHKENVNSHCYRRNSHAVPVIQE
jgi:hypothetical protein